MENQLLLDEAVRALEGQDEIPIDGLRHIPGINAQECQKLMIQDEEHTAVTVEIVEACRKSRYRGGDSIGQTFPVT